MSTMPPFPDDSTPDIEPDFRTPKTIGTLNIVFAPLLLLCSLCSGMYMLSMLIWMPMMGPMMEAQQKQVEAQIKAERQAEIQDLVEQEEAAETEEEKEALRAQRQALEAQPLPVMPDFGKMWEPGDPRVIAYSIANLGTGLLFNVLMLISGIGLIRFQEWGRKFAMWVAGLKIVRLLVVHGFFILVVVPIATQRMAEMFREIEAQQPSPAAPGDQMAAVMGIMMTAYGAVMIVLGAIYPIIVLWFLSRPRVKLACQSRAPQPTDMG